MANILTSSIQDYLKTIYVLTEHGHVASTSVLAGRLGLAPASVTGMIQRLAAAHPPLVDYQKHQGVTLTEAGRRTALEVIRHHRLIETYLVEILGYAWDEVHEEACRLEHAISEDFETRIAEALGHPKRDPHGEPIPNHELVMPDFSHEVPLNSLQVDEQAIIRQVPGDDPAFLRHIESLNLVPGMILRVTGYSSYDRNLTLQLENEAILVIGPVITEKIFVEVTA